MPVPQTLTEINENLASLAPELEGWKDFARLNLQPETLAKVNEIIATYDRRILHLTSVKVALESLLGDDYPEFDVFEVGQEIYADLKANNDTIDAAFAKVAPLTANTLGLTVEVRPKSQ